MQMTDEDRTTLITWGVDGFGVKWFLCNSCREEFGSSKEIDYFDIDHKCKNNKDDNK